MDFRNCYAKFSNQDHHFEIGQRKWILGLILLLAFSPGFYFLIFEPESVNTSMWVAYLILGAIFFTGVYCIAFYRKASFDKARGMFWYERGFIWPWRHIEGMLGEIECVKLYTYVTRDKSDEFHHADLSVHYHGKNLILAEDGPGTNPAEARKLAVLIGCSMKLTGRKETWGVEQDGDYVESPEEACKNEKILDQDKKESKG